MIALFLSLAFAQPQSVASSPEASEWPTVRAGRIVATPDWSDYHIYPRAALEKDQQGRVQADLRIGRDGRPTACRILSTSYHAELDAGTCELMMKMRFEPARDATGRAVESHYSRPAAWRLTDEQPFASGRLSASVRLENGSVKQCHVEAAEGQYVAYWSGLACNFFSDATYYFGDHAKDVMNAHIEVRLDAGDGAVFLQQPWRLGTEIATEKVAFTINTSGDASGCTSVESHGFGPRGLNNLSPCGRLLSTIWFAAPAIPGTIRKGAFETRVIAVSER